MQSSTIIERLVLGLSYSAPKKLRAKSETIVPEPSAPKFPQHPGLDRRL